MLALLCAFVGCRGEQAPPTPRKFGAASAEEIKPRPSAEPPELPALVASALVDARGKVAIAAPAPTPRHLAFGKGFVVALRAEEALVLDSTDGHAIAHVPMHQPRSALSLPNGSVFAASAERSYRFDPGQASAHPLPRLSLLPGFSLEPSREAATHLWVLQPGLKSVQRWALAASEPKDPLILGDFPLESERVLADYDGGAFTTLRDGSFLYSGGARVFRALPKGAAHGFSLPQESAPVWRFGAAERLDRAWAVTPSGEVALLEFAAKARVVRHFRAGLPFDFAATPKFLAFITLQEEADGLRRFAIGVYDASGALSWSQPLGEGRPSADPDWVQELSADREIVVSTDPPRVAVGGAHSIQVFDATNGRPLFRAP